MEQEFLSVHRPTRCLLQLHQRLVWWWLLMMDALLLKGAGVVCSETEALCPLTMLLCVTPTLAALFCFLGPAKWE